MVVRGLFWSLASLSNNFWHLWVTTLLRYTQQSTALPSLESSESAAAVQSVLIYMLNSS